MAVQLDHLRRYAVARSLFKPTTLSSAIRKRGFVPFTSSLKAELAAMREFLKRPDC
jgi:hypothetical protein